MMPIERTWLEVSILLVEREKTPRHQFLCFIVLRTVSRGASGIDGNSSDFAGSQQSETRLKRSSINLLRLPVCADKSVIPS